MLYDAANPFFKRTNGGCRSVLLVGPYAVKWPSMRSWQTFLYGLLSNLQEVEWTGYAKTLAHVDPDHRLARVLCRVPGGFLLLMERAYVPRNMYRKFTYARMDRLRKLFPNMPFDGCPANFGFIGRRLVMVDYG